MIKVELIEEYNTAFGRTLVINDSNVLIRIGDEITDNNGHRYIVKKVIMPTRPDVKHISLVV